jgi:hypothetical protein
MKRIGEFMKYFLMLATVLMASNASAIEFITEEQVQETLEADKVIEISKGSVYDTLILKGNPCHSMLLSKSARTYVVKKGDVTSIYATTSGLASLKVCGEL